MSQTIVLQSAFNITTNYGWRSRYSSIGPSQRISPGCSRTHSQGLNSLSMGRRSDPIIDKFTLMWRFRLDWKCARPAFMESDNLRPPLGNGNCTHIDRLRYSGSHPGSHPAEASPVAHEFQVQYSSSIMALTSVRPCTPFLCVLALPSQFFRGISAEKV